MSATVLFTEVFVSNIITAIIIQPCLHISVLRAFTQTLESFIRKRERCEPQFIVGFKHITDSAVKSPLGLTSSLHSSRYKLVRRFMVEVSYGVAIPKNVGEDIVQSLVVSFFTERRMLVLVSQFFYQVPYFDLTFCQPILCFLSAVRFGGVVWLVGYLSITQTW